jgi:Holliday junction DNA helicase RuvA
MISQLKGNVVHKDARFFIIDVSGVGYRVFSTSAIIEKISEKKDALVWTYLAVRENALDLYGFENKEDLDLFELLITVSGIGPKTALGVMNVVLPETIRLAISSGDTAYLTKVSGVGKKIAEKIVMELRGKFEGIENDGTHFQKDSDAIEALKSLGYSQNESRDALKKVSKEIENTGEKVKQALKILGSKI